MTHPGHIIVGAGLAGAKGAQALRKAGHTGPITLIGDEAEAPYNRPPLSKEYLNTEAARDSINVQRDGWYADNDVDRRRSTTVTALDPAGHHVTLSTGERLPFDKLLLSTGSRVRRLSLPGAALDGVMYLRTVADSDDIRHALATSRRIVIIGGGWIALELAAAARVHDVDVTVLERSRLPLLKVLGEEIAQHFSALHLSHGVDLRCDVQVAGLSGYLGRVTGVDLTDGTHLVADAVFVGIGVTPRTELATDAGLDVNNGVLVDASLRTSHPDIYAVGDIANAWHPLLGRRIRVEHWANASWQPRVAAQAMLGFNVSYDKIPYFYTDQYDLSMEYTGYVGADGYDQLVVRGDPANQSYVAFWLKDDVVLAGMNVNTPNVLREITTLVRSRAPIDASHLADADQPLNTLVRS